MLQGGSNHMKYATRINSFLRFDSNLLNAFRSIGSIEGVDYVDLNYPEHFADYDIEVIKAKMAQEQVMLSLLPITLSQLQMPLMEA